MSTLLQSREIPHSPEEACLELWSMQDSLSSKCCPLTTLEIQKACDLLESTRTSASDSSFIGEESGQPNQGTTQSRGHTPPSHQRLWRDLWNFIHIVENLRLLTLSDTLVNEKNVIHLCLGVLLAVSTNIEYWDGFPLYRMVEWEYWWEPQGNRNGGSTFAKKEKQMES